MKVGFLVASYTKYTLALQQLLQSMEYIPADQIIVVIGGAESEAEFVDHRGVQHYQVTHNSFDHTACIDRDLPADWTHVFLLHDTMQLATDSYDLICAGDPNADAVAVWNGQCNLMLVKRQWFEANRDVLRRFKNCSKVDAVVSEGHLWKTAPRQAHYKNNSYESGAVQKQYGGADRLYELYHSVHIVKWKANWILQPAMIVEL